MKFLILVFAALFVASSAASVDRQVLMRNWFLDLFDGAVDALLLLTDEVFLPAITESLQDVAGLTAQLTAGLAVGGLDALLALFGQRFHGLQLEALFTFAQHILNSNFDFINQIASMDFTGIFAQIQSAIMSGNLSGLLSALISAKKSERFLSGLTGILTGLLDEVLLPAVEGTLQDLAGLAAQLTAGLAVGGLDALVGLLGRSIFDQFLDTLITLGEDLLDSAISTVGLTLTQLLANFANGQSRSFWESLTGIFDGLVDVVTDVATDLADNAIQTIGLTLTQLLANFAQGQSKNFLNGLLDAGLLLVTDLTDSLIQTLGLSLTQLLANFANGQNF